VDPPSVQAWEAITDYVHDPPEPELSPATGAGLAGMETFAGVVVPGTWTDTIAVGGATVDVEVSVGAVDVAWGDGAVDTFPPEAHDGLIGYPDGLARHVYEVKTCRVPGRAPDCHPDLSEYPLTVRYRWFARWRLDGGPWLEVDVPPSETTVGYPVTEIVSTLTDGR
jgi:hypothetical protein